MADKKISELTSLLAADVATNDVLPIVDSSAIETKKLTAGDLKAYTFAGNIPLTGSAVRITGDFSNATLANRVIFQTSTSNNSTFITTIPNGSGPASGFETIYGTDLSNCSRGNFQILPSEVSVRSAITGTGTYLPMTFYTGGSERVRIDTSGNVGIGKTPTAKLDVNGNIKSDANIAGGYIAHAAGTTAMGFASYNVVRVTPNATATYTSTVPEAGSIVVLSVLTSGVTSYDITFGTGFKSTGTLASGTVSARYFNLTFVSDGTNLIETARTVAIA